MLKFLQAGFLLCCFFAGFCFGTSDYILSVCWLVLVFLYQYCIFLEKGKTNEA